MDDYWVILYSVSITGLNVILALNSLDILLT